MSVSCGKRRPVSTLRLCGVLLFLLLLIPGGVLHVRGGVRSTELSSLSLSRAHLSSLLYPYSSFTSYAPLPSSPLESTGISDLDGALLRHFFHDYPALHRARGANTSRVLVFRPAGTGLGDIFSMLTYAFWCAVASGRVLQIRWEAPFALWDFLSPASGLSLRYAGDPNMTEGGAVVLTGERASLPTYEQVLLSDTRVVWMHSNHRAPMPTARLLSMNKPDAVSARGMWEALANTNFQRGVYRYILRPSADMRRRVADARSEMRIRARPYVGVHARLGKGVGEGMHRFTSVSARMKEAADCLASRAVRVSVLCGAPLPLPVFLATDTAEFRALFREAVRKIGHGRVRVEYAKGRVVHTGRYQMVRFRNGTQVDTPSNRDAIYGVYLDLLMLGNAEHVIALTSSFARFAAVLGSAHSITELRNDVCLKLERW